MRKIIKGISLIIYMFLSFFVQAEAKDLALINLDSLNILEDGYFELTVDNKPADFILIKQDNILYIDPRFFASFFGTSPETIAEAIEFVGKFYDRPEIETVYVPLFPVLKVLGFRYTYSSLYGKEIIRIRTDNGFKIYDPYVYESALSEAGSYGNIPYTPPGQLDENGLSQNGYPVINSAGPGVPDCGGGG